MPAAQAGISLRSRAGQNLVCDPPLDDSAGGIAGEDVGEGDLVRDSEAGQSPCAVLGDIAFGTGRAGPIRAFRWRHFVIS